MSSTLRPSSTLESTDSSDIGPIQVLPVSWPHPPSDLSRLVSPSSQGELGPKGPTPRVEEELLEAPFPYNRTNADVILRTHDGLEFRLQSQILLEASPVFETLLSLPQPQPFKGPEYCTQPAPVIDISESARVLSALMRICYPIVKPKSRPLQEIEPVLRAALKYEMELPIAMLSDELLAHAPRFPLKVWAIACRAGLEDVARYAAELMLSSVKLNIATLEDMDGISAGHVFRLHEFHRLHGEVDRSFTLIDPPLPDAQTVIDEPSLPTSFVPDVPNPDIIIRSSDEADFAVHRGALSVASPLLQAKIDDALRRHAASSQKEGSSSTVSLPTVPIDAYSTILASLLKLCYPGVADIPLAPSHVIDLLLVSERLGMDSVRRDVLDRWALVVSKEPILAFLHATRAGLDDCANVAAKCVLESDFEGVYVRAMEYAPPLPYHRLRMHSRSCREIVKGMLGDIPRELRLHGPRRQDYVGNPWLSESDGPGMVIVPPGRQLDSRNSDSSYRVGSRIGSHDQQESSAARTKAWVKICEDIRQGKERKCVRLGGSASEAKQPWCSP